MLTPTDDPLRSALVAFVPSAATGVITALVAVRLALSRFRKERWWERKEEAYSAIFLALFHLKSYAGSALDRIESGGTLSDEHMKELAARSAAGHDEIGKAVAMGNFVLSAEAVARLEKLEGALDDPHYSEDLHEEISADLRAVTSAIQDLRSLAKHDLKIRM